MIFVGSLLKGCLNGKKVAILGLQNGLNYETVFGAT
jgi:hypothetical protein